ncbi:hypothetical protein BD779DRAFT_1509190 [Infundibulicybe gibba]|nr:hypothetical protein BD779DRAFT_1509190 [Infundibulicybe gibba]
MPGGCTLGGVSRKLSDKPVGPPFLATQLAHSPILYPLFHECESRRRWSPPWGGSR